MNDLNLLHKGRCLLVVLAHGAATALLLGASTTQAQSLIQLFDQAKAADTAYLAVKAQADATLYRAEQARAGLGPTANLAAAASQSYLAISPTTGPNIDRGFGTQQLTLSGTYPLYRPAN